MDFTKAQQVAISHKEGPCLVLAVPGAGKTTVLLERLHRLIEQGVPASAIASITFSKKQAVDMEDRFRKQYGDDEQLPTFSTIHAFCYHILRHESAKKGISLELLEGSARYNKYRIIQDLFHSQVHRLMTEDEREDFFRIDGYLKNSLSDYPSYRKKFQEKFPHFQQLQKAYDEFKRDHQLIDFDDMLLHTLRLLDQDASLLKGLQQRFQYLQVDEAQDTSLIQLRIIQKIAQPENNLFMVADDDQAIYGFRGANPAYLLHFQEFYPQAKKIVMEDNYRSTAFIVTQAGQFITHNSHRYGKQPASTGEKGEKIKILKAGSLKVQENRIIKDLQEDRTQGTVAILFRNNLSAIALGLRLAKEGQSFRHTINVRPFFRQPLIRDLEDILEFAQRPEDISLFRRIYYKLNAYLKKSFLEELTSNGAYGNLLDELARLPDTQSSFYRENIQRLKLHFSHLAYLPLKDALEEIDDYLGYGEYLKEQARRDRHSISSAQRTLESLKSMAATRPDLASLPLLLREAEMLFQHSTADSSLILSTIHGAKGLEFDTVYMIDLIQGEFPTGIALESEKAGSPDFMEEERRLFYVGMTRAKKRLKLIARNSVNGEKVPISEFITTLIRRH